MVVKDKIEVLDKRKRSKYDEKIDSLGSDVGNKVGEVIMN